MEENTGRFLLFLYAKIVFGANVISYGTLLAYFLLFGKTDTATAVLLQYIAGGTALLAIIPLFIASIPIAVAISLVISFIS